MICIFEGESTYYIRINFATHSLSTNVIFNELNVYNLSVFDSFNFYETKSAKEYTYVEIISQECKINYKWILKAGPF